MFEFLSRLFGSKPDPEFAEAERRTQADSQEVSKRFVFGLLAISNRVDPGYRVELARTAVAEWYGIKGRDDLVRRIGQYLAGGISTPAYDAFRAAFLARAGFGAGYLNEAESWDFGLQAVRRVQQTCNGWMAYGMGYLEGHLDYRRKQGDDAETLNERKASVMQSMSQCSAGVWGKTPFYTSV